MDDSGTSPSLSDPSPQSDGTAGRRAMDGIQSGRYAGSPFGEALATLLRARQENPWRANLKQFAQEVGIPYTTLRSAVTARTRPAPGMVERVAETLGVPPAYFLEYRHHKIEEALDSHPELVNTVFEVILDALSADEKETEE